MNPDVLKRSSALTDIGNGWFEVELFGPVEMPDGRIERGHCFRRNVRLDLATKMIQWWGDGSFAPCSCTGPSGRRCPVHDGEVLPELVEIA